MATTLSKSVFTDTFKDDYSDSAGFHRILFNSGKAVQARELTQLQTILQEQISRFGNNIFKEGAVVKPGGATINQKYEFIRLNTSAPNASLPNDTSVLLGTTFTGGGVSAKVLQVVEAENGDPDTLYVQYTNTSSAAAGINTIRMPADTDINNGSITLRVAQDNLPSEPACGVGLVVTLLSGIYYARGHFVFTEDQSKIISKYTDTATTNIGFKAVESIVSSIDDNTLFDNQGATPNLTAPGADRYKIALTIVEESDVNSDENFIHIATIKEGVIYSAVEDRNSYNIPNKVIAERIYENSGNYFVKPFTAKFNLDSANTHLNLEVSAGTAVVDGYRAARSFPTTLRVEKATDTIVIDNDVVGVDFGNYVLVDNSTFQDADAVSKGLPNINVYEQLNLRSAEAYGGSTIGTARVKAINEDGTKLRYHLFDVQMNSGQAFRNVKSIGTSVTNYFEPILENSKAVLKEPNLNTSLFLTPRPRPQSLNDISFTVQRRFSTTASVSGVAALSLSALGETFANTGDWIIATDSDVFLDATIPSGTVGSTAATISGLPASVPIEVLAYVNKSQASVKNKTLTTRSISVAVDSDGNGEKFVPLGKADIYDVSEILQAGDSTVDYSNRFTLDNGQRDNHYALGKLLLKSGQTAPSTNVFVNYRHFEHAAAGDFFAVNSYSGLISSLGYDKVPFHTFSNGIRARLYNYLDFRSVVDSNGEFGNADTVIELPQPATLVNADITYYQAKAAKLVIDREGIIRLIFGASGFTPSMPNKPDGTLGLYDFEFGPNTLNDSDVRMKKIEHKRFTMKDIGFLEKRLDKLEEFATLSALEVDTKHFQVLDSAGNDRTKSGFIVDNFTDHTFSDLTGNVSEYRASLDPINNLIRPTFTEDNIRLIYDSASSTNTIRKGDNVYMKYSEEPYINQSLASKSIRINPFSVVIYEGVTTLSPASDEWRDVVKVADRTITGGSRLSTTQAYNWNNWSWNWGGVPTEQLVVGSQTQNISGTVNRIVSEETVVEFIEDRVLQTALLPFMRSRKVFFKAEGLRPSTRVFPFFDGVNVSSFTKSETFQFYSDGDSDFGNTLKGLTAHPDGSSNLETDPNGTITGSFIIPNNDSLKFRVGTREFKLLDISVDKEIDAACISRAPYSATGYLDTVESQYRSTRVLNVQGIRLRDNAQYQAYSDGDGPEPGKGTTISSATHIGGGTFSNSANNGLNGHETASNHAAATPNTMYSNDAQASNDGGKIVCTEMYRQTQLEDWAKAMKVWYIYQKKYLTPIHQEGYHWLFKPFVEGMKRSNSITKLGAYLAMERTKHLKHVLTKGKTKDSLVGNLFCKAIHPIVYAAGVIKNFNKRGR